MDQSVKREVEEAVSLLGSRFTAFATQVLMKRDSFNEMMTNPPAQGEALKKTLNPTKVVL